MSVALKVRDETSSGEITMEFELTVLSEKITIRDLIKKRVFDEVDNYNKNAPDMFRGLVQPSESEKAVNGFKLKKRKKVDREKQFQMAAEAFGTSSLIVIVNDRQAESLDEEIIIGPRTLVSFLKLVPLVGG